MLFVQVFVYALIVSSFQTMNCLPAGTIDKIKNCFGCSSSASTLERIDSFSSAESSDATPKSMQHHETRKQHHTEKAQKPGCLNCFSRIKHNLRADHHARQKTRKDVQDSIKSVLDLREATYNPSS